MMSIVKAGFMLMSQYARIDGVLTVFWRGFTPFLLLLPALFYVDMPTSYIFYGATFLTALIASYTDVKHLNGAIKFGAGTSLRVAPFGLWFVFIIWMLISPDYRAYFFTHPLAAAGICFSLLCAVVGASFMRKCEISMSAIIYFLPVIFMGAFIDIFNKLAMDNSSYLGGIVTYIWMQGGIISIVCALKSCVFGGYQPRTFFSRHIFIVGGLISMGFLLGNFFKNTAMAYTVNPAYVSAIILLSPLWASLFYRLKGKKDGANEIAGLLVVASSIMLVLFASNM